MNLKTFIRKYVEPNTLIRLQYKTKGGHRTVFDDDSAIMSHHLVDCAIGDSSVIGVTDIAYPKSHYPEAVNITIKR